MFSILGTSYGGNGVSNFALPDLRGRAIIGGIGTYRSGLQPGDKFGAETIQLTAANLPSHYHDFTTGTVPEPASWAFMIAGFGAVGSMSRRRIARVVAA